MWYSNLCKNGQVIGIKPGALMGVDRQIYWEILLCCLCKTKKTRLEDG